jgi:hypothetical protein
MKTGISSKGQIDRPAAFRERDRSQAGQEFDVERLDQGEYRPIRVATPPNQGAVDWLRLNERHSAVDPVVLGEARFGILLLPSLRDAARAMPIRVSLIAASALIHDLTVVTRNVADFAEAKVRVIDPYLAQQRDQRAA